MEYKSFTAEFKAAGDTGDYEGHFAIFNNVDDGGDKIYPGAFEKTIRENGKRVKVFYAHDWEKLIGPAPTVLQEDRVGLYAKGRLTLDSFWGKEVWALMKDGALNEGSIGYSAVKFDFEQTPAGDGPGDMIRNLRECKLYEVSPVPLGMNPLTDLSALKSLFTSGQATPAQQLEAMQHAAQALKAGRVLSAANLEKARETLSALQAAIDNLNQLIAAAEPEPQKAHSALQLRARALQSALKLANAIN